MNQTNQTLIQKGEELYKLIDKRNTHLLQEHSQLDINATKKILEDLTQLNQSIQNITTPNTMEELYLAELKRLTKGDMVDLNDDLSSDITTPEVVMDMYGITEEHINKVKDWLLTNKENVVSANTFLYNHFTSFKKSSVPFGSTKMKLAAEALVTEKIELIKKGVIQTMKHIEGLDEMLKTYEIVTETTTSRSYANRIGKFSALAIPDIVYISNGKMGMEMHLFIRNFGHEILGHLLNYHLTEKSDVPFFIKWGSKSLTIATAESITNYFETQILEYLKNMPDQDMLASDEKSFENIYNLAKETKILETYDTLLYRLGIWTLATTKMGEYDKQIGMLTPYTIESKWAARFTNGARNHWNQKNGLLLPKYVSELRYIVDVIGKFMEDKTPAEKKVFESLMLKGMWTPAGMEDYLRLALNPQLAGYKLTVCK